MALTSQSVRAQEEPSATDLGGIGLLQTRTARFAKDGHFEVGVSNVFPYRRYLINIQALPWIEGTFRYSAITNRGYFSGSVKGDETSFKDRGADIKLRVLTEGRFRPALAIGLQDGLGTGQFSGEYLVASKRWLDLDFSLGLGWGNPGAGGGLKNPLGFLSDNFKPRTSGGSSFGGTFNPSTWFHGNEVAVFGGIEYQTPFRGISLKLEYEGNDYASEPLGNVFPQATPINVGINIRPYGWLDVSLAYERGREFMFRTSLRTNFHDAGIPKLGQAAPPAVRIRTPTEQTPSTQSETETTHTVRFSQSIEARRIPNLSRLVQNEFGQFPGIAVQEVRLVDRSAVVQVSVGEPQEIGMLPLEAAAGALHAGVGQASLDHVIFEFSDGAVPSALPHSVSAATTERGEIVGFLFDELEDLGVGVLQVDFDEENVTLLVDHQVSEPVAAAAAAAAFLVLPVAARSVVLHAQDDGSVQIVSRENARLAEVGAEPGQATGDVTVAPIAVDSREEQEPSLALKIFDDLQHEGVIGESISFEGSRAVLFATNIRYRQQVIAVGRAARVLSNRLPDHYEEFEIAMLAGGLELFRVVIRRQDLERISQTSGSVEELLQLGEIKPPYGQAGGQTGFSNPKLYPALSWSFGPVLKQHIGGGDIFYAHALGVRVGAQAQLARGLSINGAISHNLTDTFDKLTVTSPSTLPHVRSDIREYLIATDTSISRAQLDYLFSFGPDFYGRLSGGIFEEMYGGYGGELLFRPFGSRFAAGIDLNWVRQRDFFGRFEFRDYSVVTGHLNVYYNVPYQDLLFQAHIGQYLAGDKGVTFQVSRRFESGVRAGAFFTLTDIPFAVFGEGSFDKGFFVAIPFDLFSTRPTRRGGTFAFRPLTKDGGQRLGVTPRLYDVTAQGNLDEVLRDFDQIFN